METGIRSAIDLSTAIGKQIRKLLIDLDMTQVQLAAKIGENEMWMSRRLRGSQELGVNDLQRIAEALNVEVSDLFPQREGRVVTHIGAPRVQTTVPKIGPLTSLTKGPGSSTRPRGRSVPINADQTRRLSRLLPAAA